MRTLAIATLLPPDLGCRAETSRLLDMAIDGRFLAVARLMGSAKPDTVLTLASRADATLIAVNLRRRAVAVTAPGGAVVLDLSGRYDVVLIHVAAFGPALAVETPGPAGAWVEDDGFCQLGHSLARAIADPADGAFTVGVAQALRNRIWGRNARAQGGLSPWQQRRAEQMMANLASPPRVDDLAAGCRLSSSHFARAFRRSAGIAPHKWLTERRIERAKLLLQQARSLVDIALECGFSDQSHFTRVFTRATGLSPGRWRRAYCEPLALAELEDAPS